MSEQIKPCPFCGSHDLEVRQTPDPIDWPDDEPYAYFVFCSKCQAEAGVIKIEYGDQLESARRWNHRPLEDAKDAELDRLRAENARLTSELDAANARIASAAERVRGLKQLHHPSCPKTRKDTRTVHCICGEEFQSHNAAIEAAAREVSQ